MNVAMQAEPRLQIPLSWVDNIHIASDYKLGFLEQKPVLCGQLKIHYPCKKTVTPALIITFLKKVFIHIHTRTYTYLFHVYLFNLL